MNLKIALASRLALPFPSHSPPATSYSKKKVSFRLKESQKHEAVETYLARHRTRFFRLQCGATLLWAGGFDLFYEFIFGAERGPTDGSSSSSTRQKG